MSQPDLFRQDLLAADLKVRVNRRARRISLRLDASGDAILILPDECLRAEGLKFAAKQQDWLAAQRRKQPSRTPFLAGNSIPVRGVPHRIEQTGRGRDPVSAQAGIIAVSGRPASVPRLVGAWLKSEAHRDLTTATGWAAAKLKLTAPAITLRDPKTRWGSCSARGTLSLSWRLILAPPPVLDYVAMHEVAHLIEMNHSHRFWALVRSLDPGYRAQEAWLKRHGRSLHAYG